MPTTILSRMRRAVTVAALAGVVLTAGCDFNIVNNNAPTDDNLTNNPSRLVLARTATGIFALNFNEVGTEIQFYTIYGREGYNLLGNDPRETGEMISGPQDPGGRAGGLWLSRFQAVRTINTYIGAVAATATLTPAEISASLGFARTMKAYMLLRLAVRSGTFGLPIDVDRAITEDPAPFVSQQAAYDYVVALLDSAYTDLQAGGSAFPFPIAPGFTSFNTPALFAQYNRALMARTQVYRATFLNCGNACWTAALAALSQSFITTAGLPASLENGAYWGYSASAGEPANPITENLGAVRYFVHPTIAALVQNQANGAPDHRWIHKTATVAPHTHNGLTGTLKPVMFNANTFDTTVTGADTLTASVADQGTDVAIIKNAELLLLRAEANLGLGNKALALADIDSVRIHGGRLLPTSLTVASLDADVVTEILYNRLLSLLWEQGVRWIDARRYDRTASLPNDRTGDQIFPSMLVPAGECDARGLTVPCDPLGTP